MEREMSMHSDPINPLNEADLVIKLIDTLYNSKDPLEQASANRSLTDLQVSNNIWNVCWSLLDPNQNSEEVHFFAANSLYQKINQGWPQHDEKWLENQLRPKLCEILVAYASSPKGSKLVVERLSLALAAFALHSMSSFWPDAVENILHIFTPQNLPVTIAPQRICDILMKILIYIPEEYAVFAPQQEYRAKLSGQISKSGPVVFNFLHSLLIADNSAISQDCRQSILKCLTSWTLHSQTSLLEVDDGTVVLDMIYELIRDEELCGFACAALAATFCNHKAENYRNSTIDFIPKIANLKTAIDKYYVDEDIECVIKIYSLIMNFSENHSRLFLKIVLNDGIELEGEKSEVTKQAIFAIIRTILECTSAPGIFSIDESYSDISFSFWFIFFENFCYYSESFNDLICKTFDPLVDQLLQTLIVKSRYPASSVYYHTWNDEKREAYRCYRQDIGDNLSLLVQFPRSRDRILAKLHEQLAQELTKLLTNNNIPNCERPWQDFESIVFALKSISEHVPYDDTKHVPDIFVILAQVPFNESHALLYCTVSEMIAAFSDWLYTHSDHLATALNILFLGVNSTDSHVRLMSTLSLKDLTSECQAVLKPFAPQIVKSCTEAVLQPHSSLTTSEKSRLMHTIGTTIATSPDDLVVSSLNALTMPLICELNSKAQEDPLVDETARQIIYDRLFMLTSLIESLYIKQYSGNEYEVEGDENDSRNFEFARIDSLVNIDTCQPTLRLLKHLFPILNLVLAKYRTDEEIMDLISNTIKRSAKSLGLEVRPIMKDLIMLVVTYYDPLTNSNILEGITPLYLLFKVDSSLHPFLRDAFASISDKTLEVCISTTLRPMSLSIENYFRFATQVCKKFPDFMTSPTPNVNLEYIYKLALASLELPEKRTLAEASSFLCQFKQKSVGVDHMHRIVVQNLDQLIFKIFSIFGGLYTTPRNAIDGVIELFYLVMDLEERKEHIKLIVERDGFPTKYVSRDQKARFITRVTHEKNRKKFKDACSDFALAARNLHRV